MQLQSALEHYRRQQRISRRALIAARSARFGSVARLAQVVALAQIEAAQDGIDAVPGMLDEQGLTARATAVPVASSLSGIASDGRDLRSLMDLASRPQMAPASFDRLVLTQVSDAGRAGGSLGIASRPRVTGYTRMLNTPSCSRCAILAGKFYRWNSGFQRHPHCDCRHIPSIEDAAGDTTTDPGAYFDSLSTEAQDKTFTKAGAQAIREGADMGRVVNARSGMSTSQVYGRDLRTTSAVKSARRDGVRLMPESIYELAVDRADAIRLLKLYGYLL